MYRIMNINSTSACKEIISGVIPDVNFSGRKSTLEEVLTPKPLMGNRFFKSNIHKTHPIIFL